MMWPRTLTCSELTQPWSTRIWEWLCPTSLISRRVVCMTGIVMLATRPAHAQWVLEESRTTASLRGVVSLGGGVAWASGTKGTVLRTVDGGQLWQGCAVPEGAAALDFRAIQAFDENTALVMSAGARAQSRVYRTTDGCRSWKLLLTNQDATGFWDAMQFRDRDNGMLLGDPVNGQFVILRTTDGGASWQRDTGAPVDDATGQGAFAASNSSLLLSSATDWSFCTGGTAGPHVWRSATEPYVGQGTSGPLSRSSSSEELISESKGESLGCFSLAEHQGTIVAVGGDYLHPGTADDNAWTTAVDAGDIKAQTETKQHPSFRFAPATTRPSGFRSAVAYDDTAKAWVTVGPNGTDVSTDGGLHWRALLPGTGAPRDLDRDWNALSLPFVVGPHGRIAKLRGDVLHFAAPAK